MSSGSSISAVVSLLLYLYLTHAAVNGCQPNRPSVFFHRVYCASFADAKGSDRKYQLDRGNSVHRIFSIDIDARAYKGRKP
jgi:hypothetical protein